MKRRSLFSKTCLGVALTALWAAPVTAQSTPEGFRAEFLAQFNNSARKFVALAETMPADAWGWSPDEGVMSVGRVYMHVARYNYFYPDASMGEEVPAGTAYDTWETTVTTQSQALPILRASMDYVRGVVEAMSEADFAEPARLYGRDVQEWTVLLQLLAHMNEHLGQSIAYARMNGVVPPWSG